MPRRASYIKNLASKLEAIAAAHPDKAVQLWCEDEAREGQKGRTGRRWFTRGERPPGRCDKRFLSTYIFAAVRPGTDDAFALVMPEATAETMDLFLARFSATLPDDVHVALLLDQAAGLIVQFQREAVTCPIRVAHGSRVPHPSSRWRPGGRCDCAGAPC